MSTDETETYVPPTPNAALVVGPDDFLVLSFHALSYTDLHALRARLPERLRDRVTFVGGAQDVAVVRGAS